MVLSLPFQRLVIFQRWLHCGFSPWFAQIPFEACCDIRFQLFEIVRFHGVPLSKIDGLIFAHGHFQDRFPKRTDVPDPLPDYRSGVRCEKQCA